MIALEGRLGTPLFDRRPHAFGLTDAGTALLPVVTRAFDRIEQSMNAILHDGGSRVRSLRLQLPPTFAHLLAVPMLREFRASFPDLILDIDSVNGIGIVARDVDAAVLYAKPHVSQHVASLLWMERLEPMCHPDVAARLRGEDAAGFLAREEVLHVHLDGEPRHKLWQMLVHAAGLAVDVERGLVFDTMALAAQYALSGEGVALLDRHLFAAELAAGRLVTPFEAVLEGGYGYYLTVHPEDLGDPAIAQFRSWMIQRFGMPGPARAVALVSDAVAARG